MRALIAAALLVGAHAQAEPPVAVVRDVFRPGPARSELRVVDPVTLRSAAPVVRLRGYLRGWTRSPDGKQFALGVSDRGRVQIVDTARGRTTGVVRTGRRTAWWLLAWPSARRVLALGYGSGASYPLIVADPVRGRVLKRTRLDGYIVASARTAAGLALLVAPANRIGEAALVLVDGDGTQRRIALPGITAGLRPGREVSHERSPGLAVRGDTAYVASASDATVLEIDLADGRVIAHARAAKRVEGAASTIAFVGPDQLAFAGVRFTDADVRTSGLWLIDARTWQGRLVAPEVRSFSPLPEGGLAYWRPETRGLVLLDAAGRRTTVLRSHRLVQVQYAGHYAYAVAVRPRHETFVIDLRTARVVGSLATAQPGILLG